MAKTTLKQILKDADDRVKKVAVEELNKAVKELQGAIKANMGTVGIRNDTGALRDSIKITEADGKTFKATVSSEVFKPAPKEPGKRNPEMKGRYKYGTPYGKIIEFSPRIKKPFFYPVWYENRERISREIIEKIGKAWYE